MEIFRFFRLQNIFRIPTKSPRAARYFELYISKVRVESQSSLVSPVTSPVTFCRLLSDFSDSDKKFSESSFVAWVKFPRSRQFFLYAAKFLGG